MTKAKEYYRLYKEINWLGKLQNKRNPMYYRKMAMKIFMAFMNIFMLGYLFFIGCVLKDILQATRPGMEPYNLFNEGMVFLLVFDMFFRFMGQETPAAKVRPFLLLPVTRKIVTDCYLIRILLTPFNFIWMAMLIPFTVKAVFPFYGLTGSVGYLCGWWLMIVLNSYCYLLTRTLVIRHILWLLLPVVIYGTLLLCLFLPDVHFMGYFFMYFGEGWMKGHIWSYILAITGVTSMFILNRNIQTKAIYVETTGNIHSRTITPRIRTNFSWLNHLGLAGEFMKMEIWSVLRNKTIRSRIIMLTGTTILFSIILAFSPDIYGETGNAFWCYYCFFMITTPLQHALSTEGNYMDGLMVRKQLLIDLLRGKYFYYCLLELIPLVLMIPAVATQTITIGCWISYFLIAIGFGLPISMQMAVYTNHTTPMNQKLTAGGSNNHMVLTFVWTLVVLAIPLGIEYLLAAFFSRTVSYVVLSALGITGFLTNQYWIQSLYKRIYARRYRNMEGFRDSRQS